MVQVLDMLVDLAGESNGFGASSTAVGSLARAQLRDLEDEIGEVLSRDGSRLDPYTKAHLADARAIIDRVLNSDYIYNQASGGSSSRTNIMSLFGKN